MLKRLGVRYSGKQSNLIPKLYILAAKRCWIAIPDVSKEHWPFNKLLL